MWNTPIGERHLTGPEATIFRMAVMSTHTQLCYDMEWLKNGDGSMQEREQEIQDHWATTIFREMTHGQRTVTLAFVAQAMLSPHGDAPELTDVVIEAAVYEIYQCLLQSWDEDFNAKEMELAFSLYNQKMSDPADREEFGLVDDPDFLIELLLGRLLYDEDFEWVRQIITEPNIIVSELSDWRNVDLKAHEEMTALLRVPAKDLVAEAEQSLSKISEEMFRKLHPEECKVSRET